MGQAVTYAGPKQIRIDQVDDPPLQPDEVRVRTLYSGISTGTEMSWYRGGNPSLQKHWDSERHLFVENGPASEQYPITGWGYMECGQVTELGTEVSSVQEGDLIYGTWGHRSHAALGEDFARDHTLPEGIEPIVGIFSQMGPISLNGVLDAAIRIGETVAVFGLGTVGQIILQLAVKSGAYVVGVDRNPLRLQTAQDFGAWRVINAKEEQPAETIRELTGNRGADVSIEAAGSYSALAEAIRATAYSAKVVTLGFLLGPGEELNLSEEFHHNRINLVMSQIFGVSPELTYRWDRARLEETIFQLHQDGVIDLKALITNVLPYSEAEEAFRICDREHNQAIQVVLDFTED